MKYLGTCVKYETNFRYFSCVNSICGLSGNVRIGQLCRLPPVINASFSRNKSDIDKTLHESSSRTYSRSEKK
jgi:hypothetical protein